MIPQMMTHPVPKTKLRSLNLYQVHFYLWVGNQKDNSVEPFKEHEFYGKVTKLRESV
jgi:hypothetical protein